MVKAKLMGLGMAGGALLLEREGRLERSQTKTDRTMELSLEEEVCDGPNTAGAAAVSNKLPKGDRRRP